MRNLSQIKKDKSLKTIKKTELNKIKGGVSDVRNQQNHGANPDEFNF
ncbi:MAG: hypothetical protein AB8F74_16475 [Saprospiraceae bacterium]